MNTHPLSSLVKQTRVKEKSVEASLMARHSVRSFLPKPVPKQMIKTLLELASRAPSSSNMQLWKVYVLEGAAKKRLSTKLTDVFNDAEQRDRYSREISFPLKLADEYENRHKEMSDALYGLLALSEDDMPSLLKQIAKNFDFFGAPVGLIITTDRTMQQSAWMDCGLFLQSLLLIGQEKGLATCAQGSFTTYHQIIAKELNLEPNQMVVCGVALGYEDKKSIENTLKTTRVAVDDFCVFLEI